MVNDFMFVVLVFGLIFLFQGEPNLWEKIHDRAMQNWSCPVPASPK